MNSCIFVTSIFAILFATYIRTVKSLKFDASSQTDLAEARKELTNPASSKTWWLITYEDPKSLNGPIILHFFAFNDPVQDIQYIIEGDLKFGLLRLPEKGKPDRLVFFASMGRAEGITRKERQVFDLREDIKEMLKLPYKAETLIIHDPASLTEENLRNCIKTKYWELD